MPNQKFFIRICLVLLGAGLAQDAMAQLSQKAQEVWPATDAYYSINPKFRLYGTISGTKREESSYSDGAIGLFVDYFTFPVVKKIHPSYAHADSLPGRFMYLRAGYQYSATPESSEDPFKESMIVTEANARFYLPWTMLLTWKNRFDWRISNGEFNSRYRPRLNVEKDLQTEYLTFTAYGFVEYFANVGNSAVNRFKTQLGVELKVLKHVNYEVFWNHQFEHQPEIQSVDAFGMTLKIYMARKAKKQHKKSESQ
ncbi:DUF2490 domain-containing protein [Flavihumibacter fluvii]|uniref:DUF2490 domain-containing protein n=1 Tax=Flavihumibacter fluvii TaxID=2838157 RepID=UPI001BDE4331|nr:DUF2490 domain-containing protein [Flavihumibacter fluvii]ULQ54125.1 DUF2490 domain-containing protein [Flavihumibacter fluvii]